MSVLPERVMSATDLKRMELLSYLQHIQNNPTMYEDAEGQIAALHVQLRMMYDAERATLYELWLHNTWEGLAKQAGVKL